ncbi:methyltransferase dimerization domain-containing protein [Streptomyces sp. NPDC019443]|uniref:methyltransferase family protein n=1 Tax=Streptomyces sp. NPDC019443 TaxID=3365061 RepID=UPI0037BA8936
MPETLLSTTDRAGPDVQSYLAAPDAPALLALNFGFTRARVLDTALELGVFTALASGPRTAEHLARELGCDGTGLQRLLGALVGLGLLHSCEAGCELSPAARAHLVAGTDRYLGAHLRAVMDQWDRWGALTKAVRTGLRPSTDGTGAVGGTDQGIRPSGMFEGNFPLTFPLAARIVAGLGPTGPARMLDLAAAGGEWGIAVALRYPETEVVGVDEAALLKAARQRAEAFGVADRITQLPTDFDRLPCDDASFDLVTLTHFCRFAGPAHSRRVLRECARVTRPGGRLLIADLMFEPSATEEAASLVDLSLFLNTPEGTVLTPAEIRHWLASAGFTTATFLEHGSVPVLMAER